MFDPYIARCKRKRPQIELSLFHFSLTIHNIYLFYRHFVEFKLQPITYLGINLEQWWQAESIQKRPVAPECDINQIHTHSHRDKPFLMTSFRTVFFQSTIFIVGDMKDARPEKD